MAGPTRDARALLLPEERLSALVPLGDCCFSEVPLFFWGCDADVLFIPIGDGGRETIGQLVLTNIMGLMPNNGGLDN